jgi:hypothetical protein
LEKEVKEALGILGLLPAASFAEVLGKMILMFTNYKYNVRVVMFS